MKSTLDKLGIVLTEAETQRLFDSYDADGSGAIDFYEFVQNVMPKDYINYQPKDAERAKSDTSHNRLFGSIMDEIKLREERHEEGIWTPRVPENEAFLPPPSNITLTDFDASYGDGEGAAAASLNPKGEKMRMQRRAALARVKSTERMLSARTPRVKE